MLDYVYICSSGHSGSTLMEMLLASHPSLTVALGEIVNLNAQLVAQRVCSCGQLPQECPRWQGVRDEVLKRRGVDLFANPWGLLVSRERPRGRVEAMLRMWSRLCDYGAYANSSPILSRFAIGNRRLIENTRLIAQIVRELSGRPIVIDSSKDYLRMRELHNAAAPGTFKALYLTRDGRGCLWSGLKRKQGSVEQLAGEWSTNQHRTQAMLKTMPPEDRLTVRYEDLCANPAGTMQRICSFLGINYDPAILELRPPEHHTIAGNKIRVSRAMEIRLDQSWQEKLTPEQLQTFDRIAGDTNRQLGYAEAALAAAGT